MAYLLNVLRNLTRKKKVEEDLDREIRSYVDILAAEKATAGLGEEEARRAALIELGGVEQAKEAVRGVRAGALPEQIWSDLRYAARMLRRSPGFAAVAILSLALGVGVNSTSFATVNSLVLHPFAFPHMDRIMTVWETAPQSTHREAVSAANFFDWKRASQSFENLAAYRGWDVTLTRSGEPERIQAQLVTAEFFSVLGMKPRAGRTFASDEAEPGRDGEAVISYGFWKAKLASAPNALGKTLFLGQRSYSIVGIMPEEFDFPLETEVWAPLALAPRDKEERSARDLAVMGRLKPGVAVAGAGAELRTIAQRLAVRFPAANGSRSALLTPLLEAANPVGNRFVLVLFGAALFVMLLACANVANLLLARATARQKEIGVRAALGASRPRIAGQLLAEIAVLGVLGAAAGVMLGAWDLQNFRDAVPPQVYHWVPGIKRMHMDASAVLFASGLSLASAFLCGIPALLQLLGRASSARLVESLKESGRTTAGNAPRSRLRSAIVVAESALALLLLVGAGLMVKTFHHMLTFDRGFDTSNLLTMRIALPESRYRTPDQMRAFYSRVVAGLVNTPGVQWASASADAPSRAVQVEGRGAPLPGEPVVEFRAVTPGYFNALRIPIREGRAVSDSDGAGSQRIVVVSESIARHYWPNGSPVGRRIRLVNDSQWLRVAGVCGDTKDWFSGEPQPVAYIPFEQSPELAASLFLRTAGDPLRFAADARRRVYAVDPDQPVFAVDSMDNVVSQETSGVRAAAKMMTIYAIIALLLAPMGIYSLSSYLMVQRTHEIGVRMALGAARRDILRLAMMRSARLAGLGLAIGLPAAFALARIMSSALFNVVALDWTTFAAVTALLGGCALLAAYVPARRASRTDPMIALRHE